MIIYITLWFLMAAAAVACGQQLDFPAALLAWGGLAAIMCAGGGWLISHQPIGIATMSGRIGSTFVRWGYRVGRGRLMPAAGVSWLIWFLLGSAIIGAVRFPIHLPLLVCWAGDIMALLYLAGVMLNQRGGGRMPVSLFKITFALIAMIVGSGFLWFHIGTDGARASAVALAGGPPILAGAGYGIFLAISVISAKRVDWK